MSEKEKLGDKIVDFFTSNPFKSPKKTANDAQNGDAIKRENSLKRDTKLRSGGSIITTIQKDGSSVVQRPPMHHATANGSHAASSGSPRPNRPPSRPPVTTSFRRLDIGIKKDMSSSDCLAAVNTLLGQLRAMPPNDIRAFPLLNESQRLVQQLKDTTTGPQATDRDAWLYQIGELQDEVQGQTERLVSSAASTVRVEPNPPRRPAVQQAQASGGSFSSQRQAGRNPAPHRPGAAPPANAANVAAAAALFPKGKQSSEDLNGGGTRQTSKSSKGDMGPAPLPSSLQAATPNGNSWGRASPASTSGSDTLAGRQGQAQQQQQQQVPGGGFVPTGRGGFQSSSGPMASPVVERRGTAGVAAWPVVGQWPSDMFSGLSVTDDSKGSAGIISDPTSTLPPGAQIESLSMPVSAPAATAPPVIEAASSTPYASDPRYPSPSPSQNSFSADSPASFPKPAAPQTSADISAVKNTVHRRSESWSVNAGVAPPDDLLGGAGIAIAAGAAGAGVGGVVAGQQRAIKKKTRGLRVGYGVEEDPEGPSTSPSPASAFSAAAAAPTTPTAGGSSGGSTSAPASVSASPNWVSKSSLVVDKPVMAAPMGPLESSVAPGPAPSQTAGGQPGAGGLQGRPASAAPSAAARRLNLPPPGGLIRRGGCQAPIPPAQAAAAVVQVPSGVKSLLPSDNHPAAAPTMPSHADFITLSPESSVEPPASVARSLSSMASLGALPSGGSGPQTAVGRYESYLEGLQGPLEACQKAAIAAAEKVVQQLESAAAAAAEREASSRANHSAQIVDVASLKSNLSQLEQQQTIAVTAEDWDEAAALEDRIKELSERSAAASGTAALEELRAVQLYERRQDLISQQSKVWDSAAAYILHLGQLHKGQVQAWESTAAHQAREIEALEKQHGQVASAVSEARCTLALRRTELLASRSDLQGRMGHATGALQEDQQRLTALQTEIEADVQNLRSQLAEKELQLRQVSMQLASTNGSLKQAQAPFSSDLAALEQGEVQLSAQEAALTQQEALLTGSRTQAQSRREAAEAKRAAMAREAGLLEAAARELSARAEAIRQGKGSLGDLFSVPEGSSVGAPEPATSSSASNLSTPVWPAVAVDAAARGGVMAEEDAVLTALIAQRARLEASAQALEREVVEAAARVQELEAAKKSAAARRDFKEAARLSAESKATSLRSEELGRQASEARAAADRAGKDEATRRLGAAAKPSQDEPPHAAGVAGHRLLPINSGVNSGVIVTAAPMSGPHVGAQWLQPDLAAGPAGAVTGGAGGGPSGPGSGNDAMTSNGQNSVGGLATFAATSSRGIVRPASSPAMAQMESGASVGTMSRLAHEPVNAGSGSRADGLVGHEPSANIPDLDA